MSTLSPTTTDDLAPARGRSLWVDAARRIRRDKAAVICLAVVLVYVGVAIGAAAFLGGWQESYNYARANEDPSWDFWLGTDNFGRSTCQQLLLGAKVSLTVALGANLIAVPLGIALGALAGYYGGLLDDLIVWLLVTYLGNSMLTLGIASWAAVVATGYNDRSRVYGWTQGMTVVGSVGLLTLPLYTHGAVVVGKAASMTMVWRPVPGI